MGSNKILKGADNNRILLDDLFRKSESIISRRIAGEAVLVPLRSNAADLDAIYSLNETAAEVWDTIDGTITLRQVLQHIVAEFEVDESTAEQDIIELITHLFKLSALEKI